MTLPGLVMAASHAPLALATFGPLIALCFVVTQREDWIRITAVRR